MNNYIRNFCIIAHIDHGKSTLADRFLELTKTVNPRKMSGQYLDMMDLEKERGITIKMQPVRMVYHSENPKSEILNPKQFQNPNFLNLNSNVISVKTGIQSLDPRVHPVGRAGKPEDDSREYILNLIDTPGHIDFSYEVSRALKAVEGAILLIDGTKGVQAQTLHNYHLAKSEGLTIIPAINKIDVASCDLDRTYQQLKDMLSIDKSEVYLISAKTGEGTPELLEAVIRKIPPPKISYNQA